MKFVTFTESNEAARPGLLTSDGVIDLSAAFPDVHSIVKGGVQAINDVEKQAAELKPLPLKNLRLLAPLQSPPRIFCVGLNYRDHAVESKMEIPTVPTIFLKLASALVGTGAAIKLPSISTQPDYEAEFAAVVGTGGSNIAKEDWEKHIFGYSILNDVSARDIQLSTTQWTLGKSF